MTSRSMKEIGRGERFEFGENWKRFLATVNEDSIAAAEQSLRQMLDVTDLNGMRFLDAGSGSGLFSLAARRLGATVHSFDYDPASVACTRELKRRFRPDDDGWQIEEGSVLDEEYVAGLGPFDVVYSWGVLHHTGHMMRACETLIPAADGQLFIAIYNDQRAISRYWTAVKRIYNRYPLARWPLIVAYAPYLVGGRLIARALTGRLALERGMSLWHDMIDWLGGYPFEVATPEQVCAFFRNRGFELQELRTCGNRMGCNEFVFRRLA